MEEKTFEEKVALYTTYAPGNILFLNMKYLDQLGMEYGYNVVYKEIKRQTKDLY